MLTFDEALAVLERTVTPLGTERVALHQAADRTLADDLMAALDAPRTDVSIMDGYAVRSRDLDGTALRILGEARPGQPFDRPLDKYEAVRIFTGAPVPLHADAVIMQEYAQVQDARVSFKPGHGPDVHIRPRASDFKRGDVLLAACTRLTPQALLAAAAGDAETVLVGCMPRLAIIATGDELVAPGQAGQTPHAIPDSAGIGVAALARRYGAQIVHAMRAGDDLDTLSKLATQALNDADCVVVIGGASVGTHDLAKSMFASAGLQLAFSTIAIKPGRPVWLGTARGVPVLGLPGNPTSALVCARVFLAPLLGLLQGGQLRRDLDFIPIPVAQDLLQNGTRETFLRARLTPAGLALVDNRYSGAQAALAQADWLVRRAPEAPAAPAGTLVHALPL